MKVGIQGLEGSFHHQAATEFFGDDVEIAPFENFRQVFEALETGVIERALVGIENSLYGSINDTYDLLMQHQPIIVGEVYLHVGLHLLAVESAELTDVTDVYSQAPALAETKLWMRKNLPSATLHEYADTAMAARFVSKQGKESSAAVASKLAGQLHGLIPLAENIEDHEHNYTRFVVLSREQNTIVDANKTSIVLPISHKPGALYNALGAFANEGINLSKIESRPIIDEEGWHYQFYIDFDAGITTDPAKRALASLEETSGKPIILGSYEQGHLPEEVRKS